MNNELIIHPGNDMSLTVGKPLVLAIHHANRLHAYAEQQAQIVEQASREAIRAGLSLGKFLTDLKESLPHGEWGKLFSGPNSNHGWNFKFSQESSRRYMSCYARSVAELEAREQEQFLATLQSQTPLAESEDKLLRKATKGAETPRQMMLNLEVLKTPRAQHETILENRNTKGRPVKPLADKMSEAIALTTPTEIDPAVKSITANKDAAHILELLGQFDKDGMIDALNPADRDWFALGLSEYAQKFSKRKSS